MENSDDDTEEISTGKGENGIDSPEGRFVFTYFVMKRD